MMNVYVLGCGPAGLAAAHAAIILGHEVTIFSRKRKSHMFGAQYLHFPIPDLYTPPPIEVSYKLQGSIASYRRKVYGQAYDGTVSPGELDSIHMAWDIRSAYDQLWQLYHELIVEDEIDEEWMAHNQNLRPMISSVPLPVICMAPLRHSFGSVDIYAAGEAPEWGVFFGGLDVPQDTVICNGNKLPAWYRASRIFDRITLEWPADSIPGEQSGFKVCKPIRNTCTCWPDVLRVGRYGKWEKGVLVHHAFEETWKWLLSGQSQS